VRDTKIVALDVIEQGKAERSAMRADAQIAPWGPGVREGRVQVHPRVRVHDAQAVGSDAPHAVGEDLFSEKPLTLPPLGTALAEPRRDDHDAPDPFSAAGIDDIQDHRRGYDNDCKVNISGDIGHRGVAEDAVYRGRLRVYWEDSAPEIVIQQVPEHFSTNATGIA